MEALHTIFKAVQDAEKALSNVRETLLDVKVKQSALELQLMGQNRRTLPASVSAQFIQRPSITSTEPPPPPVPPKTERFRPRSLTFEMPRLEQVVPPVCPQKSDNDTTSATLLDDHTIQWLKDQSWSRGNFAVRVMREVFSEEERRKSNVRGVGGKDRLDLTKMAYVRGVVLKRFPDENEYKAWNECIKAIDGANWRLRKSKSMSESTSAPVQN